MDITNCRLKTVSFKDIDNLHMYGFILSARRQTHEFYTLNENETKKWVNALKPHVILLNFKDIKELDVLIPNKALKVV